MQAIIVCEQKCTHAMLYKNLVSNQYLGLGIYDYSTMLHNSNNSLLSVYLFICLFIRVYFFVCFQRSGSIFYR